MAANRGRWFWTAGLVALVALSGFGLTGRVRAAEEVKKDRPLTDKDGGIRKKALALNDVTGTGPMRGLLKELLADTPGTKKLVAQAVEMAKENPAVFNRNATFVLAIAADTVKDIDAGERFFKLYAKQSLHVLSERGLAKAYSGLIQLYYDNKKYAESEKACMELLRIEGDENDALDRIRPMVMRQMILSIAKQGHMDKSLGMCDKLIKADPDNWLAVALKGQVQREAGSMEDAAKTYLSVIDMVKKDKRIDKDEERNEYVDQYRYLLSGIYTDMEKIDKATEQLKALLEREPNNPTYNNDLGYIWADRNMNLAEAEKLVRKAIEEDRKLRRKAKTLTPEEDHDSAAYLDSLAWVLFKQGKAKEAKEYLVQAVKDKEGQHSEILDHLGDVYSTLGEKDEAIATWKKALELNGDTKRDIKRKESIEKKLLKAKD
jgi:tetratricopeptide (TPR) repeat protein